MTLRRALVGSTALALTLLAAGCGGGSDADDSTTGQTTDASSAAPTTTESSLPKGVPTEPPERPADEKSVAGATAFGEYVLEVWWYTFLSHDTSAMEDLAPADGNCDACTSVIDDATERRHEGLVQRSDKPLGLRDGRAVEDAPNEFTARWDVRSPDTVMVRRESGEVVRKVSSPPDWFPVFVTMRWIDDGWELVNYRWDV